MMNNELLLQSKNDIPFLEAQVNIHQPTINEISLISEESFFSGCQFLNFSKNLLPDEDKIGLENKSDFEIFMAIMCGDEKLKYKNDVMLVLTLLFPTYFIKFTRDGIILASEKTSARITAENWDIFRDILVNMFCLNDIDQSSGDYNPADARAAKIAEKLKKRKKKLNKEEETSKVAIFSRYVSILSVGLEKDKNELMEYTVFQLKDEFIRFQKQQEFKIYLKAKLAGAKDLEEVDNWMDDIHP